MKLHCHRPSLAAAVQIVSGVVPARTPKEILKNIKLEVSGGNATLSGTDQEVGLCHEIAGVETDSAGEVLLPTNRVVSILRELTDEHVELEVTEDALWLRSAHSEFRLGLEDPAEFPSIPGFEADNFYTISGTALRELIRRTVFATDVESTRYALGGVLADFEEGKLTLAATDSRRLSVATAPCGSQGMDEAQAGQPVIPAKAMTLIERSISDDVEDVQFVIRDNDVLAKVGATTVYSRLVEGRFPNYKQVIPQEFEHTIDMVVGPFHAAVRQAQIVTDEESRGVDFTFANGQLCLTSAAANIGQSKIELPISYDGPDLTITFDPRFVAEFLRILPPETTIHLQLIDPESAAVLRTDDAYTYVIMPLSRDR